MDEGDNWGREKNADIAEPFQVNWFYAVPSFMASFFVCSLIYGILPYMWGLRDVLMTLAPVLITIYAINDIERNTYRRRHRR